MLKKVYEHVDDIDLFIGMIMEVPVGENAGDAKVGKTLQCLIGDVFARLRIGDRYFYDNADQAGSFTPGNMTKLWLHFKEARSSKNLSNYSFIHFGGLF